MTDPDAPFADSSQETGLTTGSPGRGTDHATAPGVSGTDAAVRLAKAAPASSGGDVGVHLGKVAPSAPMSSDPTVRLAKPDPVLAADTDPAPLVGTGQAWSDGTGPASTVPPAGPGVGATGRPGAFSGPTHQRGGGATGYGVTGYGSAAGGTAPFHPGPAAYATAQAGLPPRRSPVLVVVAAVAVLVVLAAVGGIWWLVNGGSTDRPASVAETAPAEAEQVAGDSIGATSGASPTASPSPTRPVQPNPEAVWASLLDAPSPRLCGMAPGRFSDGVAGGSAGQAWLAWRLPGGEGLTVQQSTAFVDVTGDGIDDVAVVEQCNTGGDSWFDYIVFYEVRPDGGVALLDGIGLVSVTSTARAYFDGFVAADDGVVVLVNAGNGSIDDLAPWRTELSWTGSAVEIRYAARV